MNRIAGGQKGDYAPLLHHEKLKVPRPASPSLRQRSIIPPVGRQAARWRRATCDERGGRPAACDLRRAEEGRQATCDER